MALGRRKSIAGWGSIGFGLAVAGLMVASRYYTARTDQNAPVYIVLRAGCLKVCWGHRTLGLGLAPASVAHMTTPWLLWVAQEEGPPFHPVLNTGLARVERFKSTAGPMVWIVGFMLWPIAVAAFLAGGTLVWSGRRGKRRVRLGLCEACGYDLNGLTVGAACPECGAGKAQSGKAQSTHEGD